MRRVTVEIRAVGSSSPWRIRVLDALRGSCPWISAGLSHRERLGETTPRAPSPDTVRRRSYTGFLAALGGILPTVRRSNSQPQQSVELLLDPYAKRRVLPKLPVLQRRLVDIGSDNPKARRRNRAEGAAADGPPIVLDLLLHDIGAVLFWCSHQEQFKKTVGGRVRIEDGFANCDVLGWPTGTRCRRGSPGGR